MTDEMKLDRAKKVYDTLCEALEEHEWKYEKDEDELVIKCGAQGEDLPMDINITVSAGRQMVLLLSHMPFVIAEDKRLELAVAVSIVNNRLVDGCFDYNIKTGYMVFRMTNSFLESTLGKEVFSYMLFCSCQTIDEYNDKFLMLAKGMLSLEQFIGNEG